MARARRLAAWLVLASGGLLLLLALVLGLAYGYLQTDGGRDLAAREIERLASTPGEVEVEIGRLTGRLPFAASVDEVRVRDAAGVWLAVEGFGYEIDPAALLDATLRFRRLEAERVRLDRLPAAAGPDEPDTGAPALPRLPVAVRIERLAVGEVALGPAVLGEAAAFRVEGEATSRDGSDVAAALTVARSDGEPGSAEAKFRYAFAERFLDVDARVEEPAGGLIVRSLGLDGLPALEARIAGQGALSDWNGELSVNLEDFARASAKLRLSGTESTDFSVMGSADTTADFAELPWRLFRGHVAFEAAGRWRAPSRLVVERGRVTSPTVDLSLSGIADLDAETLEAKATAQVSDPQVLQPYLPDAEITDLRLSLDARGRLDAPEVALKASAGKLALADIEARDVTADARSAGALSRPRLSLDLKVAGLSAPDAAVDALAATASFVPDTGFDWSRPKGRLAVSGTVGRLDVAALRDWSPAIGQDVALELEGEVDAAAGRIADAALSLETGRGRLAGKGAFDWESGETDATLELGYPDLAPLGRVLGQALGGRLEATAEIASPGPLGVVDARIAASVAGLVVPDPIARGLVAPSLDIGGRVARDASGSVSVTGLRIASPAATVTGDLELAPDLADLAATYRVELADLAVLSEAAGQPLSGAAVASGRVSGSFDSLEVTGDLEVPNGSVAAQPVKNLRAEFTAADLTGRPNGRLSANLTSPVGEVSAGTRYLVAEDAVELSSLTFAAPGLEADGRARLPMAGAPVALELDGRVASLEPWLALAGLQGGGAGPFRLSLSPDGPRQAGRLEATLEAARLDLAPGEPLTVGKLTATIDGTDLLGSAGAKVGLAASHLTLSDLDLANAGLEASGDRSGGEFSVTAAGTWFGDLKLDGAGRAEIDGERIEVAVSRLSGHAFEQDFSLAGPAQFVSDGATMSVSGLDLAFGEARLQAAARRAPDGLSADVTVSGLPVAALRPAVDLPFAEGSADARVRISGPPAAPEGDLSVEIRKLRLADAGDVPPVDLSFTGRWRDGILASSGRLSGLSDEDVALSLDLPLRLDPESLAPVVPPDGPLAGELNWQGPIDPLWDLVPAGLHELSGVGNVQARIGGTVAEPDLGGTFELRNGRYESLEAGTLLKDLTLAGDLSDRRIQLSHLSATDGGKGTLSASGAIEIEPDWGLSGELKADFRQFTVLRRDDITAVAKGQIAVTGSPDESKVEGRLETDTVEVSIPDRLPPDVVVLNVEEAGAPPPDPAASGDPAAAPDAHRMTFDIAIDIPRRAFIRGRGIESEWAGALAVTGTDDKMAIKGQLNLVRGQVAALGKTFRLTEGSVTFLGDTANDPTLNFVARHTADDLVVTISVSGPLSNPKLAFSSVPALPEDEVISRVLFGKATAQLSAIEAAQLAASVAELTGQAGGPGGLLGRLRSTIGVDVLRLETSGTGDSTTPDVAAGKYLTDDVYVGAKQGATADSGAAEIEVELTPNISIESSVGQQGQSEVGVNFKWDY